MVRKGGKKSCHVPTELNVTKTKKFAVEFRRNNSHSGYSEKLHFVILDKYTERKTDVGNAIYKKARLPHKAARFVGTPVLGSPHL